MPGSIAWRCLLAAVTAISAGAAATQARAGDCCGNPNAGLCCCEQPTPCCDDLECCDLICGIDPFCCEVAWDTICVNQALSLCRSITCPTGCGPLPCCGNPRAGSCCIDDGTPCCDDVRCCATVCSIDPFCCDINWDQICIDEAHSFCGELCPLSCFQIVSDSTECIGAGGEFNYQVVGTNTCTGSSMAFDFVASGGDVGQQMCFKISLFDNNGDLCCNATVCTTVPDCLPNSQPCDLDGDQAIGVTDLLVLLAAWGSDPGVPPDYDGDGTVGTSDVLHLLSNWGPCK